MSNTAVYTIIVVVVLLVLAFLFAGTRRDTVSPGNEQATGTLRELLDDISTTTSTSTEDATSTRYMR